MEKIQRHKKVMKDIAIFVRYNLTKKTGKNWNSDEKRQENPKMTDNNKQKPLLRLLGEARSQKPIKTVF